MSESASALFRPLVLNRLTIAGRLVKSASSETRATADGFCDERLLAFYEPIAAGQTPLIITGNIYVSPDGKSTPGQAGIDGDDKVPGLRRLTDAIHRRGSVVFAQLSHCGRQVIPAFAGIDEAVSASGVKDLVTGTRPRALRTDEIDRIVRDFGGAASRCVAAGFDGIQIHAGHGYLISQFLTPYTNRRSDGYGGSLENRARLLREVYQAIRDRVGPDYPVIMKINGADELTLRDGLETDELVRIARIMEDEGLDGVEVSVGHYESGMGFVRGFFMRCFRGMLKSSIPFLPWPRRLLLTVFWPVVALVSNLLWGRETGFNLKYARHFTSALSIPVICVGGFLEKDAMESAIDEGLCDAVSSARALIADPLLYRHLRDDVPGPKCLFCNACVGHIGRLPLDCYHPQVRKEKDAMLETEMQELEVERAS